MRLGELIKRLESLPQDMVVENGFGAPDSYRGFYEQLAFRPEGPVTVASMLRHARSALGETFQGYKGGDFKMDELAICNIAEFGMCSDDDLITHQMIDSWVKTNSMQSKIDALVEAGNGAICALEEASVVGINYWDCGEVDRAISAWRKAVEK